MSGGKRGNHEKHRQRDLLLIWLGRAYQEEAWVKNECVKFKICDDCLEKKNRYGFNTNSAPVLLKKKKKSNQLIMVSIGRTAAFPAGLCR